MEIEIAPEGVQHGPTAWRSTLVALIGPCTVLAGVVWAVAQPYRLTLVHGWKGNVWEQVTQPPLLVAAVGIFFMLAVARPLLRELERDG